MTTGDHASENPLVSHVLDAHLAGLHIVLADELIGFYLHGSLAHGGFGKHSDIDFLVAVRREPTGAVLQALRAHHRALHQLSPPWSERLEGSYAPLDELRSWSPDGEGWWYIDNGAVELERSRHDDTLVVRATLLDDGVALAGPPIDELIDPVDRDELREEIRQVMAQWGRSLLDDRSEMTTAWYQRFAAMSYARMLQTLDTGRVGSKRDAVGWAAENLEPRWADLVRRSVQNRGAPEETSRHPGDPGELSETRDFIRYAIAAAAPDPREVVRAGYDRMADVYLEARDRSGQSGDVELLREVLAGYPRGARVLDVGCGAGDPVAIDIVRCGHEVVGVDISEAQIRLAAERIPEGTFVHGDITDQRFDEASFDLVVAYFSLFHIPRERHAQVLEKLFRWLKPGGTLIATIGRSDLPQKVEPAWLDTAPMYWSHFDPDETIERLGAIGFDVVEVRWIPETIGAKQFEQPFVVARRPR